MDTVRGMMIVALALAVAGPVSARDDVRRGAAAFGDWRDDAPGVRRHITLADLEAPVAEGKDSAAPSRLVARPKGATPKVPDDVVVSLHASGFDRPRVLRTAPNGDVFLAESGGGRVLVFKAGADGAPAAEPATFAKRLPGVYGLAFYPGDAPKYLYAAMPGKVVRFDYASGDAEARGAPATILDKVPDSGHWTRDLAVAPGGQQLLLAVGSASNVAESSKAPADIRKFEQTNGVGAAWSDEERRAAVWIFDPDGKNVAMYANGLRNCSALVTHGGSAWCAVNERDRLGDDVPFEYVTRVAKGAFFGWPWYYLGAHEDPRHPGRRPDLKDKIAIPDVLIQAHSAPLGLAFYDANALPAQYRGNAFVALHGSWNRGKRTGYKVVRLPMKDGKPTGEYVDFMTGFVVDDASVWGRPVGVAVAKDGSLIVSEDGSGTLWRVVAK